MRRAPFFAFLFFILIAISSDGARAWPVADCSAILLAGHPKPAWGSNEKLTQEGLLLMINYQMAISACQQDEVIKLLRQQPSTKAPSLPLSTKAKNSEPDTAKPKEKEPAKMDEPFPKPELSTTIIDPPPVKPTDPKPSPLVKDQ
jgi:hypothetical protein